MHAEDLLVDDGCERQHVEDVLELLPHLDVVSALALVVEAVDPVDRRALVVAAQHEKVLGVLDLVGHEQRDTLQPVLTAVDVVAGGGRDRWVSWETGSGYGGWRLLQRNAPKKQIVGVRREAAVLEEPQKVAVLAVYVAADLNGRLKLEQCRLSCQDRCTLLKQIRELVSAQVHVGARFLCRTQSAASGGQATHARVLARRTVASGQKLGNDVIDLR